MKTLYLLLICGCIDWSPVIIAIPCICWGILGLIALCFTLKYIAVPLIANSHEKKMKEDSFKMEKKWKELIDLKACTDDALKDQVEKLKISKDKLEKELEAEKNNKGLLEKQLKLYSDIFEKLNIEIKPKEKKS